ncbi:MAG: LOG family protein [PVC group bacterium]
MRGKKKITAVFGSAVTGEDTPGYRGAVDIGRIIGEAGYDILCGGYGGVMEAVCRGCRDGGGRCHGIGLRHFPDPPNPYINEFVKAKTLGARLDYFVAHADLFLALDGGIGTITEIMFVWDLLKSGQMTGTTVFLYGKGWENFLADLRRDFIIDPASFHHLRLVSSPEDLKHHLVSLLKNNVNN